MRQVLIFLLLILFSLSFGQMWWRPEPGRMFAFGVMGFLFLVLVFLLFSIIFWAVYLFIVKGKSNKEKKEG